MTTKIRVAGIRERETGKVIFSPIEEFGLVKGDQCVFEGSMGLDLGTVVTDISEVDDKYLTDERPITIIRKVTTEDLQVVETLKLKEKVAFDLCRAKISQRNLLMQLVRVKYLLDQSKAIFFFTAENRIDFRELVRDLASEFRCRIEMKQIGVRDKARMIGSLASCGRQLCCCAFLRAFETVSIKMAKEQDLTLIPTKISGMCGRLMCCLMYEYENYMRVKNRIPKIGKKVQTSQGPGRISSINIMKETVFIDLEDGRKLEFKATEEASKDAMFTIIEEDTSQDVDSFVPYDDSASRDYFDSLKKLEEPEIVTPPPAPPPEPPPQPRESPRPEPLAPPQREKRHHQRPQTNPRPQPPKISNPTSQPPSPKKVTGPREQPADFQRKHRRPKSKGSNKKVQGKR